MWVNDGDNRHLFNFPCAVFVCRVDEALPVLFVDGWKIVPEVVARPTGFFTEKDGPYVNFSLVHSLNVLMAAHKFMQILGGQFG